jgi:flagellar protein FlgJ
MDLPIPARFALNMAPMTAQSLTAAAPALRAEAHPAADQLRQAGEGFEALFLTMLLKSGRAGLPGDDLTGSGAVTSAFGMLDAHLAQDGATAAGLGIADAVVRQFSGSLGEGTRR